MTLTVLDLFSGIGGFSLGLEQTGGFKTVAFCEIDPYCHAVLRKHWPDVPIFEDVTKLEAANVGQVDVICGGFPCQDISQAGQRRGIDAERSGLWREFVRLISEIRPQFAIVENVSDLLSRGLGDVLGNLAEIGYDAEWHCLSAADFGSPQGRGRVWIIAYPSSIRCQAHKMRNGPGPKFVPWPNYDGLALAKCRARHALSEVRRMDHGLPKGLDRLRALGNAVVPQVVEVIGHSILASKKRPAP